MKKVIFLLLVLCLIKGLKGKDSKQRISLNDASSRYSFIENRGQVHDQYNKPRDDVKFYGFSQGFSWFLRPNGISYQLTHRLNQANLTQGHQKTDGKAPKRPENLPTDTCIIYRVDFTLEGTSARTVFKTIGKSDYYYNFYNSPTGSPVEKVYCYSEVLAENVLDGVSIRYFLNNGHLETDYIAENPSKLTSIKWRIEGAQQILINQDGNLEVHTPYGVIVENKPIANQSSMTFQGEWLLDGNYVKINFEGLSEHEKVIVDPPIRVWGTYFGGTDIEYLFDLNATPAGGVIASGTTYSASNIATTGAHQTTYVGNGDGFLALFDGGGVLQWATYYGGS